MKEGNKHQSQMRQGPHCNSRLLALQLYRYMYSVSQILVHLPDKLSTQRKTLRSEAPTNEKKTGDLFSFRPCSAMRLVQTLVQIQTIHIYIHYYLEPVDKTKDL